MRSLLLAAALWAAERELIKEDITIKAKGAAAGPAVAVPPPAADRAILREALESLDVYRAEHRAAAGLVRMDAARRRLERPFPEAPFLSFDASLAAPRFERWGFEVLRGDDVLWQASGAGPAPRLEWDGSGAGEKLLARVGEQYRFRFVGWVGGEERALESEPVRLTSMAYKEFMGDQQLEVANSLLFESGSARWAPEAGKYLAAMAGRMRRVAVKDHLYRLVVRNGTPARAKALRRELARQLLIAPERVVVEVASEGERGDVTAVLLPPEKGAALRLD